MLLPAHCGEERPPREVWARPKHSAEGLSVGLVGAEVERMGSRGVCLTPVDSVQGHVPSHLGESRTFHVAIPFPVSSGSCLLVCLEQIHPPREEL